VAKALHDAGVCIVPVPVYYPDVDTVLGQRVYRRLQDIPIAVDIVDVFRRPEDLMPHLDDILSIKPKVSNIMGPWFGSSQNKCVFSIHEAAVAFAGSVAAIGYFKRGV
jgi:predicted CoA-binding protein